MQNSSICQFPIADSWTVLTPIEQRIKDKIERMGTPLKDWDIQINYGIKTGLNEAFIISGEKRQELITQDPKSAEIIRPILRGRDIKRYGYEFADLWLINTHNGIKEKNIRRIYIDDYPAIKTHLDFCLEQIKKRSDQGDTPYNLRNCAYMDDFSKQKIVWGNLNLKASFSFAPKGMFINAPCAMLTSTSKYLLAVLNSKLSDYYIRNLGVTRNGGYFEYKPMFIEKIPIPQNIDEALFNNLIDNISNNQSIEREIDCMIYKLYNLTSTEIEFIENIIK